MQSNEEVDSTGLRVTVGAGSAYDLSRKLKQAQIVRAPSSPTVVDTFMSHKLDVAAGVKQQLQADEQRVAGLRLLPGRFTVIEQAPKCRGEAAADSLRDFIEAMKASGFVAQALKRHGMQGATVADFRS